MSRILCIGEEWKGSNASGLFYALSRLGFVTTVVNELRYVSLSGGSTFTKVLNRSIRKFQVNDFNVQLRKFTNSFAPDVVLVYKGAFTRPDTIHFWKKLGIPVVNFFPDVSFLAHGKYIPSCVPLYDHIFTTKSFGANDLLENFKYPLNRVTFLPHAFDPMVHRKYSVPEDSIFRCDASFIGNYSKHKETYLGALKANMPDLQLKIWGRTWAGHGEGVLRPVIQGIAVHGDAYALAINASEINIALLSEQVSGASKGDQITSRTFHIPGSGGFMLHQRTDEVLQYFDEDEEIACFSSPEELISKIDYYKSHESERRRIREKGYQKAIAKHSLDERAKVVIEVLKQLA